MRAEVVGVNTAGGDVGAEVAKKVDKVLVLEHSLLLALAKHLSLSSLLVSMMWAEVAGRKK